MGFVKECVRAPACVSRDPARSLGFETVCCQQLVHIEKLTDLERSDSIHNGKHLVGKPLSKGCESYL